MIFSMEYKADRLWLFSCERYPWDNYERLLDYVLHKNCFV
jgi:hypothetical protein